GLWIVEDAAEAHFARYKDRPVGSLGDIGMFSFYGNKIITCGEGGALVLTDKDLEQRARLLRGQGMDPQRRYFFLIIGRAPCCAASSNVARESLHAVPRYSNNTRRGYGTFPASAFSRSPNGHNPRTGSIVSPSSPVLVGLGMISRFGFARRGSIRGLSLCR